MAHIMEPTHNEPENPQRTDRIIDARQRAGRCFLVLGALLIVAALFTEKFDLTREAVARDPGAWTLTHMLFAGATLALAVGTGAFALSTRTGAAVAWFTASLSSVLMMLGFALEASAIPAASSDALTFNTWRAVSNLFISGLAPFSLALGAVALDDGRAASVDRRFPRGISFAVAAVALLTAAGVVGDAAHVDALAAFQLGAPLVLGYVALFGFRKGNRAQAHSVTP